MVNKEELEQIISVSNHWFAELCPRIIWYLDNTLLHFKTYMKKISTVSSIALASVILFPLFAYAQVSQVGQGFTSLGQLVDTFTSTVVKALGTLFLAAAVVAFFYGIVQYIWGLREGNGEKAKAGSTFMVWGIVALFVMFSVWGIIYYFQGIFGIQGQNNIVIPKVQIGTTLQNNTSNAAANAGLGTAGSNGSIGGGTTNTGSGSGSSGYRCTPGYECTLSGGGIGLCDSSGLVCVSNTASSNSGDAICVAYGDGTGCTTSTGLSGVCVGGICTPNNNN